MEGLFIRIRQQVDSVQSMTINGNPGRIKGSGHPMEISPGDDASLDSRSKRGSRNGGHDEDHRNSFGLTRYELLHVPARISHSHNLTKKFNCPRCAQNDERFCPLLFHVVGAVRMTLKAHQ